jgi:hypothetical protein
MDQRRLESIRQSAQLFESTAASGTAHDDDAPRLVDSAGDFSDILVVRVEFRAGLQGGYTEGSTRRYV